MQEALYVISYLGRDRFVWATSAAEARAKDAAAPSTPRMETPQPQTGAIDSAHAASGERRVRHAHVA